jgi:putative transcriptional regulator
MPALFLQSSLDISCKARYAYAKLTMQERSAMDTRIRELRQMRRMTQQDLADAVGTTRQTITSIEVGKYTASLPLAHKIARYFGLPIEEVFLFEEEDNPSPAL